MKTPFIYGLAISTILIANSFAQSDGQNERFAVVVAVKGDATYTVGSVRNGKVRSGLSFPEGTRIVASPRATVDLYFRQIGTVFRLTPGTDLTLEKLDKRVKDGVVIKETVARLDQGRILTRARVLVPDSIFEIRTKEVVYSVPETGIGRYDIRANGTVIVGKKSQLALRAVEVSAASTNMIMPSQVFNAKEHRAKKADADILEQVFEELTELDDLAKALTPPPRPEELPK